MKTNVGEVPSTNNFFACNIVQVVVLVVRYVHGKCLAWPFLVTQGAPSFCLCYRAELSIILIIPTPSSARTRNIK